MSIINPEHIRNADSASHFDAGSSYEKEANAAIARFDDAFPPDSLTDDQKAYLDTRRQEWRDFVSKHFNEICYRRSQWMPVNVCGPARYPAARMQKRLDKILSVEKEYSEKAERFFVNTERELENLVPLEEQLKALRAGKWRRGTIIPTSDPHVIEKLKAMREFFENKKVLMKGVNKAIRQGKTPEERLANIISIGISEKTAREMLTPDPRGWIGFAPYELQYTNADIKRIVERIEKINQEKDLIGWTFDGGEVIANTEINRLQIRFDERPSPEMHQALRRHGFHWSPRNTRWQRQLTQNAFLAAQRIVPSTTTTK